MKSLQAALKTFSCLFLMYCSISTNAQSGANKWELSTGAGIPLWEFGETHIAGATVQVSYSEHRFGTLPKLPKKKISYLLNGGITHYFGKTETVSGYDFKYGGYSIIHTYAGGIFSVSKNIHLGLVAGPALSRYKGNMRFNTGSNLSGAYYFNEKWGVSASLLLLDETGARLLWSTSLKACYAF